MEEIIKILERTNKIYDEKLEDAISLLKKTNVEDDAFDKLLNKVSSLISLKIQKAIKNGTKLILENEFLDYCTHGIPEETE